MSNTNQSMIGYIKDALTDLKQTKISYFGNKFSAEEVFNDVACVGTFLKHNGVKKGDSVIICLPNIPQGVVALYAINSV
ncbi:MAG: AMP-binding protein, partial [Clostridia bacterium]|nr:AMP-binding protein [Clostridia bacterium]